MKDFYVAVDFDGTIVTHEFPSIGEPNTNATLWMKAWHRAGAKLILFTMRSGASLQEAVEYLKDEGVTLYGINHNPDQDSWTTSPKAYAHVYIDDAAFGCPLVRRGLQNRKEVDWDIVGPKVLDMINKNLD